MTLPANTGFPTNIPDPFAETPNGKSFRLRGQGMPQLGQPDKRGDLYADVTVILPTHLNEEQRRLFEAFARSIGYDG